MNDACPVCKSEATEELWPAEVEPDDISFSYSFGPEHTRTLRVVRCRTCTHIFCSPVPELTGSYDDVVDPEYIRHETSRRPAAAAVLRVIRRHIPRGRLLDVGCATGDFLAVAQEHYEAEGVEPSHWACEIARGRGLTVHQGPLSSLQNRTYDVVTLFGVIEHFIDPSGEIDRISRLLRPRGLVVIWTGDAGSLLARALGRRWWYWQGQHIQYFTRRSLRLLVSPRFEHVAIHRYPFAATHQTLSNSLRRYRFHRLMSALLSPLFAVRPIIYLRLPGEMLYLGRRS